MQRGERRGSAWRRWRGKELGEGAAGAVEALEQRALTGVSSCEVGGESGAPLLEGSGSGSEISFARGES